MAEVHDVPGTTVELQTEQIKACKMCCWSFWHFIFFLGPIISLQD